MILDGTLFFAFCWVLIGWLWVGSERAGEKWGCRIGRCLPPHGRNKAPWGKKTSGEQNSSRHIRQNNWEFPLADDEDREFQQTTNPMSSRLLWSKVLFQRTDLVVSWFPQHLSFHWFRFCLRFHISVLNIQRETFYDVQVIQKASWEDGIFEKHESVHRMVWFHRLEESDDKMP